MPIVSTDYVLCRPVIGRVYKVIRKGCVGRMQSACDRENQAGRFPPHRIFPIGAHRVGDYYVV